MNENAMKLVENTIKDMLLGNTAVTFLFAFPIAYIAKHGLILTLLSPPSQTLP